MRTPKMKWIKSVIAATLTACLCFGAGCGANDNAEAGSAETARISANEAAGDQESAKAASPTPKSTATPEPTRTVMTQPAEEPEAPGDVVEADGLNGVGELSETQEEQDADAGTPDAAPPAGELPAEELPAEEFPVEEIPAEEFPMEEVPAEGPASEEPIPEEIPAEPVPEESLPTEEAVGLDLSWEFAGFSAINSGTATLFRPQGERKGIVVGVNAGHGTSGGASVYTQCHPDGTPKVTGGSTAAGATEAMAVSTGMTFHDGTPERDVNLQVALIFKDLLLANGYDVLMIRSSEDVQLDNIARTVICNNRANCHIAIHYDGDGLDYDKGCYYMAVADGVKGMYPVSEIWTENDRLGECLISGLSSAGCSIMSGGSIQQDLTQTSYSKIPSVDVELGNAASDHSHDACYQRAAGLLAGVNLFFGQ